MPRRHQITQSTGCMSPSRDFSLTGMATSLSTAAVLSLYKEVALYPKPGLVSPVDSGSHKDMNYQIFLASINSLRDYFKKISAAGAFGERFSVLQKLGIDAEARMMLATRGINTHRGAIFNLGLLCAAAGYLRYRSESVTPEAMTAVIFNNWGSDILATGELKAYAEYSHGQQMASKYGVQGARYEVVTGFPAVQNHGLPSYRKALRETACRDAAAVQALFAMMAHLDDTNILWRAGDTGLLYVKSTSRAFLESGGVYANGWRHRAVEIHRAFVQKSLSPGGAADLLGVTLFMNTVCD